MKLFLIFSLGWAIGLLTQSSKTYKICWLRIKSLFSERAEDELEVELQERDILVAEKGLENKAKLGKLLQRAKDWDAYNDRLITQSKQYQEKLKSL